jgi:hypothetical protein
MFGRAQYKFLTSGSGFLGRPVPVGPKIARAGETTAPCGLSWLGPNPDGENPPDTGKEYFEGGTWVMQVLTRAGYVDRVGYERLTHRELPFVGARLRFRPDSPRLASNFSTPSRDWRFDDGADYTLMPTISFYRRYWDGGWRIELVHRTTQQLLEFTGIGPVTRQPAFLP